MVFVTGKPVIDSKISLRIAVSVFSPIIYIYIFVHNLPLDGSTTWTSRYNYFIFVILVCDVFA